jgi:SAM-dependent methyltransferase
MKKTKAKPYDKLALVYDHLMDHVNYNVWTRYVYRISRNYVNKNSAVLELAGGNGKFSKIFKSYFRNILVTDKSLAMLSSKKNDLPEVCCEMVNLPFKKKFDLIYSTFDSVNYLLNKKDLLKLFHEIKNILSDTGIFTFDISLERNSELFVENHEKSGKAGKIEYEHISTYNRRSKIHLNIFEIHLEDGTVYKEVHRQKIYSFQDYFELLSKAGLIVIECYEAFTFNEADQNSKRVQFIVRKNSNAVI